MRDVIDGTTRMPWVSSSFVVYIVLCAAHWHAAGRYGRVLLHSCGENQCMVYNAGHGDGGTGILFKFSDKYIVIIN